MTQQAQDVEYKSINDILPSNLKWFYTYPGSLTTPPCHQVVNWIVMYERLLLNAKQIEMFRNLYSPIDDEDHAQEPTLIMPNVRHLQPVFRRQILASFAQMLKHDKQIQVTTSQIGPNAGYPNNQILHSGCGSNRLLINGCYQDLLLLLLLMLVASSFSLSIIKPA